MMRYTSAGRVWAGPWNGPRGFGLKVAECNERQSSCQGNTRIPTSWIGRRPFPKSVMEELSVIRPNSISESGRQNSEQPLSDSINFQRLRLLADHEPQNEGDRKQHQQQPPPLFEDAATTTGNRPHGHRWDRVDEHFGRGVLTNHRDVEGAGLQQRSRFHACRRADSLRLLADARLQVLGIESSLGNADLDSLPGVADRQHRSFTGDPPAVGK